MVKATLRSAVLLGLVSIGMLITSMPSFAEVQNVRVSGDITVRAFQRKNLDLHAGTQDQGATSVGTGPALNSGALSFDDDEAFLMSTVGINVGADLTENVSAFIRLANERDWNNTTNTAAGDFDLSQAYITLKELFYSPLTLRIGQQPIVWGRGFIIGSGLLGNIINNGDDRNASISANEYTDFTAFDAIRATLDLSGFSGNMPLTADYVFIKADESLVGSGDDITINGVNLSTSFEEGTSEFDVYLVNTDDNSPATTNASIFTFGVRGSTQPVENSYVYGEIAYQTGTTTTDFEAVIPAGSGHQAWAANLGGEYTFADMASTPRLGSEWRYYSGKKTDVAAFGWRPVAPGYFRTAIREFQTASTVIGFYDVIQAGVTSGSSNQHELALYGGFNPIEDLTVDSRVSWFILDVGAVPPTSPAGPSKRNRFVGTEWDTQFTYDYTDDVQFGLLYALFLPGNVFRDAGGTSAASSIIGGNATAQQIVTTVSLKF